jgi:hypothetical protein
MSLPFASFNPLAWLRQTRRMRRFTQSYIPPAQQPAPAPHFAVVVMPWLGTAVPWFSIAIGMVLAASGSRVSFVVDSLPFGEHPLRFRMILLCIGRVLGTLSGKIQILRTGPARGGDPSLGIDHGMIARLATLNAVWALRGETSEAGRTRYTERILGQLQSTAAAAGALLGEHGFECVVVPGGVYGPSGVWAAAARARGIRLASFDSGGRGFLTVAADGVACQLQDIPRSFTLLKRQLTATKDHSFVRDSAVAELERRRAGTDKFSSQLRSTSRLDSKFDGAVLLALNSPWDSAALGLHRVFDSSADWIVSTVRCLLRRTGARVVVRQHPAERFDIGRSTDDYGRLLRENFADDARVVFIAAADPVNTYDLLDRVSTVVVYTSTIGVEAALKGKVVITPSSSYYSDLGFVWRATTEGQYDGLLTDAVAGCYEVSDQMRADALLCYYLTQCCNWISSPLSPEGFDDWVDMPFADLIRENGVQITNATVRDNVPASYLAHLVKIGDGLHRPAA